MLILIVSVAPIRDLETGSFITFLEFKSFLKIGLSSLASESEAATSLRQFYVFLSKFM